MKKLALLIAMLLVGSNAFAFDLGGYTGQINIKFFDYTIGRQYDYTPAYSYQNQAGETVNVPATWSISSTDVNGRAGLAASNTSLVNGVNYENNADQTADSWGIMSVSSIHDADDNLLWYSGKNNEYINGVMYGFNDVYLNLLDPTHTAVGQIGGTLDLYLSNSALNSNGNPYVSGMDLSAYNVGGTQFSRLTAVPGVINGTNWTRYEVVSGLTSPFAGTGSGYFSVQEGWGSYDWVLNGSNVYTVFDFAATGNKYFDAKSDDPATATATPEPATMSLLGMGLAGLVLRRRKAA